ncbi:desmoplakin-like isoform X2 [Solea senegalensis]|uniref:Desmoplakin-like isoform X2 n=1 Tax=Solea senegalensis TaxID=28829 RepID=A0AAV6SAY8_SOLSE|nr:desmoplakin isoform X3 [Solea senegalensis]KAG7514581.1 desmoplakin-like isoform X2 [Solea senegalensis]
MSYYGSQQGLNVSRRAGSKSDLTTGGTYPYSRSEILQGGGNGYDQYMDGFKSVSYSRSSKGGMVCTMPGGMSGGMVTGMSGGMVGMPGGMVSTMPGGMVSGMTGGMVSGMSGGMVSGMSGGMSGGMVSGMSGGMVSGMSGGMSGGSNLSVIHQRAMNLQAQCQEYLKKAEYALQSGGSSGEAEQYMAMAKETIEQLKSFALDLRHMGQPNDNVVRTLELCKDQLKGVHMAITGSMRRRSTRKSSGGSWEEPGRSFHDALGWIAQQKRLIETAQWGDDPAAIQQQLNSHQNYHSSIQRSMEVDRARDDLVKKGDKGNLHALEQEWDSLQQMSFGRTEQLQELLQVLQDISKEIMWVNDREEEELVFDWGDKNIEQYIPRKQESYSKLMSSLEAKEKDLNKLKSRVDTLLKNSHPASEKIEAYQDTLQTQWSWLLQITKCIDTHLKENAAYSQFFKEANETYSSLQKEHENVRKKFTCDKNTSLENLLDLLKELERERERIMDNKRQVQHVVNKSKSIVRLKPRNPEEKSSSHLIVKALCDFKQDQKLIHKGDEAILKDNSQRSKWHVTGPGGLDMLVPSVCLIIPPPNPLCVSLANKNDQYYEAILSIWNQLYINVKSLIAWQFCLMDIKRIKSLTMSMLIKMRPEEYHQIIKSLESHYEEFKRTSHGSQMFVDDDKRSIENQFSEAQTHYNQLVVQLPTYIVQYQQEEARQAADQQNQLIIIQQQQQQDAADAEARRLEEERYRAERKRLAEKKVTTKKEHVIKKEVVKVNKTEPAKRKVLSPSPSSSRSLSELHALRLRLEETEGSLSQHVHICLGEEGMHDCGLRITKLETTQSDIDAIRQEFLHLREQILRELEGMSDPDKAQFLRSELSIIDQRLGGLEGSSSAYLQRLRALRDMLESVARAEDIVKVHEARLTEKETASLSPSEVEDYILALKNVKAELDQKKDLLTSMEAELSNVNHWNGQVGGAFHRCDMVMSKYREQVGLLSDRWRRIQGQMDTRLQDLQLYLPQLQHYKKSSSSLSEWIDATRKKQDVLQSTKIDSVHTLKQHITNQKELNSEIKARREVLESVLKDNEACVNSVKDYEMYLASYTSGLETLLNIPIKRTMLRSPTMDLSQEATQLQTRYMELLTQSGDYYRFLGDLLKNMEELKMRNTRIDLLEEELRLLREDIQDRNSKNKSLEDAVARYQLELSQSQNQLLSMEEVKRHTALQTSATKESLDSTHNQLADLNDQVARLNYLLEEEKMKRRLAEERYSQQKEEFESVLRKRQKELETVSWSKVEMEKSVVGKDNEIEQLRRQLADEAARNKELQREMSKMTAMVQSTQSQYSEIVKERDALLLKFQYSEKDKDSSQMLEEELARIKLSLDSELRNKQHLQEENERVKRDLTYWKDQYESKQSLMRQHDTDKEHMERENYSLKSEIDRLMRELRELEETNKSRVAAIQKELQEVTTVRKTMENELKSVREPPTLDASTVTFDGVRKPVTAKQLLDCGVLDKPIFNQLVKGHKTVPEVSEDKKVSLKGTGPIAGVVVEGPKGPGSISGPCFKMTFTEAKAQNLLPPDSVALLLDAQAATGHIIDPRSNQKLTVEEACNQGVVDEEDRERLSAAEAAAVGYRGPGTGKPLSVFQAMKKGLIDKNTTLRLLQAQESVGGILDPIVSVFLPKDMAMERDLFDDDIDRALNKKPKLYLDPESEEGVTYMSMKRKCKVELNTGLLLLPVSAATDPSKLVFDGVRKTVTAKQLHDCGVLDKPTFKDLINGKKAVEEVSVDKSVILKGTGPIAGIVVGSYGKMSLSEAKKQMFLPVDCADLLLEAQAATGHIIDPINNQKLTVDEACTRGVVDIRDRDKLLAAEAAAVGYKESTKPKPLSVFEAIKKGLIDKKTGLRHLQAQESVGGILDPNLSVFLPKDIAIKRNLLDENLHYALNRNSTCFLDPETEQEVSYGALKKICKTEPHTGLLLLPVTEKLDPSQLIFDGVRKSVTAQQLLDCGVLDKRTFNQLIKGEKTVPEVSVDKKIFLKGTGSIAGVAAGPLGKMLLSEAKKQMLMPTDSADLLLDAQAATGHIIDTTTNQKLTVEEACAIGVVDNRDRDRLLVAEAAAVGYRDPTTGKPLSVSEAIKKGLIDKKTGLRLLQAQESAGGILDPNLSVFLPRETAIKRKLLDTDLCYGLDHSAKYYVDPDTECDVSYGALKKKSKTESHTGLILLPIIERKDPSKLMFEGVRKPVSAKQLFDCGVLDKPTFNQLMKGEKTVQMVSREKMVYLKGTGAISGVVAGNQGKLSLVEAKKQNLMPDDSAYLLLEAQAATGYIIDPKTNQKLTVEEACAKGVVDIRDRQRLLVAEAAAVGYDHPSSDRPLSVYEAMKKGIIDRKTALRYLQAQESVGGILDPILSVFLPKEIAMKRNLLDETLCHALKLNPACYLDPEPEHDVSYGVLKGRCMKESNTGLQFLQISEHFDPSKLVFDGVRKTVTAEQLLESGILDKSTFHQLIKGEKSVQEVSVDKKLFLKGTGSIAGVASGPSNKMSLSEAKKKKVMNSNCADMLLDAQAATGHIIDPKTNQKLTVKEACAKGLVAKEDESRLFAFEAAAIGYRGPNTSKVLSAGQALRIGLIDKDTTLRILQAQESVGGILDPALSVFIPKDIALGQGLIDEALYHALNQCPKCYLDPATQQATTYVSLKKQCKVDPTTGLLFLPEPKKPLTVQGLRGQVSVKDLVDANLLEVSVMDQLSEGRLTSQEIENRLRSYLRGSTCIAGVYDEASDKVMPIYQAMKDKLLRPGTTLELLEAQAASGFIVDPVNNLFLTVSDAYNKRLFGPEFKTSLLAAERAVTGYKLPGTDKIISLFGAIERGLVEKGHGIRLLEAQIASGGIIDPEHSHRIDVNVAYKRGYFDENMNKILTDESDDSKGFFDPNTEENLTYLELKKRCITDKNTGLILLPIIDQKKLESTQQNTRRKRRVVIVDPETNKEMTIREAYNKGYIDHDTFLELSEQECEWEEITITAPDGSKRFVIIDKKAGIQYDIDDLLEKGVINKSDIDKYRSNNITLTQLADIVTDQTRHGCSLASRASAASVTSSVMSSLTSRKSESSGPSSVMSSSTFRTSESSGPSSVMSSSTFRTSESSGQSSGISSSSVVQRPLSPTLAKMTTTRTTTITERSATVSSATQDFPDSLKQTSSVSITLASPVEAVGEQEPVGAIFDTENVEKISIMEALNRGLVDSITAQRLLEAQACTGGIVNPANGQRVGIQEASRLGIISDDMASNLKPAQKAYFGFEDVKTRRKMSVAEALKEMWLPYEAGQRFMEFQFVTGGLYDPEADCRRSIEDALKLGWLDMRSLQKLQDIRHHSKILTCPKSKLKISYKEALDNCMVEESSGVKMLQASSVSSRGISSPYNVSSAPGSTTGSRSGSRRTSRRSSMDLGSSSSLSAHYSHTSFTSYTSK